MVANLLERWIPYDGLPVSFENASQDDVGNDVEFVVQGPLKEREYEFQPEAVKKRIEQMLPKKFDHVNCFLRTEAK